MLLVVGKVTLAVGKAMLASEHRLPQAENPLPDDEKRRAIVELLLLLPEPSTFQKLTALDPPNTFCVAKLKIDG
jgi:hypothetical protein